MRRLRYVWSVYGDDLNRYVNGYEWWWYEYVNHYVMNYKLNYVYFEYV